MTFRAVEVLKQVDVIYAEDTRTTGVLLKHFGIETHAKSYHKFNEHKMLDRMIDFMAAGHTAALVSDAGMPGISDPGWLLTDACIKNNILVESLPGSTAFIPALVNSGLPCDKFCFEGFLPQKKGRKKRIKELTEETRTMVFYESPYRIVKALEQFAEVLGEERRASVSRELTKIYEETRRGTLKELARYFSENTVKGEFVLVIEGLNKKYAEK
jgi:16S rRNA (cytidine1402-2'-O)-methyltransferase